MSNIVSMNQHRHNKRWDIIQAEFIKMANHKADWDVKHNNVRNGYSPDTPEWQAYEDRLNELGYRA